MKLFRRQKTYDDSMHELTVSMCGYAHEIAKNNGHTLDYSDDSIALVDQMLPGIVEEFKQEGIKKPEELGANEGAMGIAESFGCYIVACIEQNHGKGVWIQENDGNPWPGFITEQGVTIYPLDWVMKKMLNPKHYSINEVYDKWIRAKSKSRHV